MSVQLFHSLLKNFLGREDFLVEMFLCKDRSLKKGRLHSPGPDPSSGSCGVQYICIVISEIPQVLLVPAHVCTVRASSMYRFG